MYVFFISYTGFITTLPLSDETSHIDETIHIDAPEQFRDNVETSSHYDEEYGKFLQGCYEGSDNLDGTYATIINDTEWTDNLLGQYFNVNSNSLDVDNSIVEQGNAVTSEDDLPWLSPNTTQILDNFTRQLNENPSLLDLMNIAPVQSNLIDHENELDWMNFHRPNKLEAMLSELGDFNTYTSPIVEQSWGGGLGGDDKQGGEGLGSKDIQGGEGLDNDIQGEG